MSAPVQAATSYSPAGIVRAIIPWVVVLVIAVILIVVIFGAKPTIGGLQI